MRRRIFIAINLPQEIKNKLISYQREWPELPVRWIMADNLHITLVFIGYVSDEELLETCKTAKEVAKRHSPFSITINRICYGPIKKMPPRMIWAVGEKSQEFASLKNDLDKSLLDSGGVRFSPERREFSPHITLGRIRQWEWRRIEPEERPVVDRELNLTFQVASIEVMESKLKRGGAEYAILESEELGGV
jgi:2'-5' RNA ligase